MPDVDNEYLSDSRFGGCCGVKYMSRIKDHKSVASVCDSFFAVDVCFGLVNIFSFKGGN